MGDLDHLDKVGDLDCQGIMEVLYHLGKTGDLDHLNKVEDLDH